MNNREKILSAGVALVLGAWFVGWFVDKMIKGPLEAKDLELSAIAAQVEEKQLQLQQARDAEFDLRQWQGKALPADVQLAQNLYLEYLQKSLARVGIDRQTISPSSPQRRGEDYVRLPWSIKADFNLKQLSTFLHQFHSTELMHQITRMTIQPSTRKDKADEFQVTMNVDALSMHDATTEAGLPGVDEDSIPKTLPAELTLFATKNPFQPTRLERLAPPSAPRVVREQTVPDERGDYRVTAAISESDDGWFSIRNSKTKKELVYYIGDQVEIGGLTAKVIQVNPPRVLLQIDGELALARLGRDLTNLQKQGAVVADRSDSERDGN